MEETIGYEALFSAEEWDSLDFGEWTDGDGFDPDGSSSPSGVTRNNGKGSAALSQEVASEGDSPVMDLVHKTRIFDPPGQYEGDEDRFDVECDLCGWLTAADTIEEAQAIVRLHESFVAELVAKWEVA